MADALLTATRRLPSSSPKRLLVAQPHKVYFSSVSVGEVGRIGTAEPTPRPSSSPPSEDQDPRAPDPLRSDVADALLTATRRLPSSSPKRILVAQPQKNNLSSVSVGAVGRIGTAEPTPRPPSSQLSEDQDPKPRRTFSGPTLPSSTPQYIKFAPPPGGAILVCATLWYARVVT